MKIEAELIDCIDVSNTLGEGVVWRDSDQTVWWTDILEAKLFRLSWPEGKVRSFPLPERLGSFGFVAGDDSRFVCAFESGFAIFQPDTGEISWLSRPKALQAPGLRLNDGKVAPDGSFWAGSMNMGAPASALETGLYRLDSTGNAAMIVSGLSIPNGLAWSPSGSRMYFSDSRRGTIFERESTLHPILADHAPVFADVRDGSPDGAATDSQGRYWSAIWGGAKLIVFSDQGAPLHEIPVQAPQPTCIAFGGLDGNLAFVTSARTELDSSILQAYPKSGSLFVFRTNACGSSVYRYSHSAE
jgi:sugar lactone lactonase YvrE